VSLTLTSSQEANASTEATRPIFLVELGYAGGAELLSTGGEVVYDGRTFLPAVDIRSLANTRQGSIEIAWTPQRVARVQAGDYRGQSCKVWYIPAPPESADTFAAEDGILLLDGLTRASVWSGRTIQLDILHRGSREVLTPRVTLDQVTSFAAAAGTQIEWDGEIITLEARR